jgi:hypothetical protein
LLHCCPPDGAEERQVLVAFLTFTGEYLSNLVG